MSATIRLDGWMATLNVEYIYIWLLMLVTLVDGTSTP